VAGIRADQVALYKKDMYKAEREGLALMAPKYPEIFKVLPSSTGAGDKETQLLGAGRLERHTTEGQDINFKAPVQGWESLVKFWTYSAGLSLTKEAVADTVKLGNLLQDLARTWGKEVIVAKEELTARVFNNGGTLLGDFVFDGSHTGNTDSSGDLMYDSESLFVLTGDTRTTKGGGTYFNAFSGYTMTPANFETMYNQMTAVNNRDEEDNIVQNPCDTVVCEPGSDYFLAERILQTPRTQGLPFGQNNDINPYHGLITKIIPWDYLDTAEGAFYVGKRNHDKFCFCERQMQETDFFQDHNNRGYKASIDARFGVWMKVGSWRAWVKGGGTYA